MSKSIDQHFTAAKQAVEELERELQAHHDALRKAYRGDREAYAQGEEDPAAEQLDHVEEGLLCLEGVAADIDSARSCFEMSEMAVEG